MITANHIKNGLLFCLLFSGSVSTGAQVLGSVDVSYPEVQRILLKPVNTNKTAVPFDSTGLHVFIFLSPECPLCKNYSLVLNTLQKKFSNDVRFHGIVPGRTYTEEDIQQYVNEYRIQFPIWIDLQKELSNYMKATITPEVVLLNKSGGLVYRGAIDDWVQSLGQKKLKPEKHYLEEAIIRYLQKKEVLVKQTLPVGCLINEF